MKQIPFPHQFCIFNLPPNIHSVLSTPGRRAFGLSRRVFCRSFALTSAHSTSPSSPLSRYPNRCMHAPATHTTRHQSNQQHLLLQSGTLSPHLALSPASHQTHFSHQSPSIAIITASQHPVTLRWRIEQVPGRLPWVQGTSALPQNDDGNQRGN
jgi:hypothetical protein